jgi:NADPH:quinone reductase-like Zn-dependent oxidoreductase
MPHSASSASTMRTVRFQKYGEPAEVLSLEHVPIPAPLDHRIRVRVYACGVNPADWALCKGLFPGLMPRGIGLEVSGTVDAVGGGVTDVAVGDDVFGTPDWAKCTSAGAADYAVMDHWSRVPAGLSLVQAAALPMAVTTADVHLRCLGIEAGETLLVNGAGTTVGFAAAQMGLIRGVRVIATSGHANAGRLRALGAEVTSYGDGLVERVLDIARRPVDWVLDTAPASGVLPALVQIAGGEPRRVLTISDFAAAPALGVRHTFGEKGAQIRYDVWDDYAARAAAGTFSIPIARMYALNDWRAAFEVSQSGHARGKLVLLPAG